jgi:hypothetical protein
MNGGNSIHQKEAKKVPEVARASANMEANAEVKPILLRYRLSP